MGICHHSVVSDCLVLEHDCGAPWGAALPDGSYLLSNVYTLPKLLFSGVMQDATQNALHEIWDMSVINPDLMSIQFLLSTSELLPHGSCCMACDCLVSLEWGFTSGSISHAHGAGCQKHTGWNSEHAAG